MSDHDDIERQLAQIWAEVLHIAPPGPDDDFFEIGGDSLLATKVILLIRRTWQVDFTVRLLLDAPVLSDLAAEVRQLRAASATGTYAS
jgi:acyl carrier protein